MEALVHTVLLTAVEGSMAEAVARLDEWRAELGRGQVWTGLGQAAWMAHLAADYRLVDHVGDLLAVLEPFVDRVAVLGQVGHAGPVALATARLHALRGDRERALVDLALAEDIADRTGAKPTETVVCAVAVSARSRGRHRRPGTARGGAQAGRRRQGAGNAGPGSPGAAARLTCGLSPS